MTYEREIERDWPSEGCAQISAGRGEAEALSGGANKMPICCIEWRLYWPPLQLVRIKSRPRFRPRTCVSSSYFSGQERVSPLPPPLPPPAPQSSIRGICRDLSIPVPESLRHFMTATFTRIKYA